mmetsp:Transcript_4478/g.10923  ORF Transcript_4478/g.10923 Transcript_4478/m.10923 type:complete len:85 (+) Transcript_4478:232-486(+)
MRIQQNARVRRAMTHAIAKQANFGRTRWANGGRHARFRQTARRALGKGVKSISYSSRKFIAPSQAPLLPQREQLGTDSQSSQPL